MIDEMKELERKAWELFAERNMGVACKDMPPALIVTSRESAIDFAIAFASSIQAELPGSLALEKAYASGYTDGMAHEEEEHKQQLAEARAQVEEMKQRDKHVADVWKEARAQALKEAAEIARSLKGGYGGKDDVGPECWIRIEKIAAAIERAAETQERKLT